MPVQRNIVTSLAAPRVRQETESASSDVGRGSKLFDVLASRNDLQSAPCAQENVLLPANSRQHSPVKKKSSRRAAQARSGTDESRKVLVIGGDHRKAQKRKPVTVSDRQHPEGKSLQTPGGIGSFDFYGHGDDEQDSETLGIDGIGDLQWERAGCITLSGMPF